MEKIAQFYKVSEEQFINDWRAATGSSVEEAKSVYANIRLPRRATKGSAGYDFFAPESFTLVPHETILIPTGIRVMIGRRHRQRLFRGKKRGSYPDQDDK